MRPPMLSERFRLYVYVVAFTAWAVVMGADAYFSAIGVDPPAWVVGSGGVVEWLVGAGLLTAATHTPDQKSATTRRPGAHRDDDGDGSADGIN